MVIDWRGVRADARRRRKRIGSTFLASCCLTRADVGLAVHVIDFRPERAATITEYASRGASAQSLADGTSEAHVYAVHLDAGGEIGQHPAGFAQPGSSSTVKGGWPVIA